MSLAHHPCLQPLTLSGGTVLRDGIMPAPMDGILSEVVCAAMMKQELAHCWMSSFIRVSVGVPRLNRLRRPLQRFLDTGLPTIAQVMGKSPEIVAGSAKRLTLLPLQGVNLNMACPSKTVLKSGAGGQLLKYPDTMMRIAEEVRNQIPSFSLSFKIRAGYSDPRELEQIIPPLKTLQPDFIALHFRTVLEEYRAVEGREERLKRALDLCGDTPLIISGDIFDAPTTTTLLSQLPCRGVMVARGLFSRPWLMEEIRSSLQRVNSEKTSQLSGNHFFLCMLELACSNSKYWNRNHFSEIARHIFGAQHPLFELWQQHRHLPPEQLLTLWQDTTQAR